MSEENKVINFTDKIAEKIAKEGLGKKKFDPLYNVSNGEFVVDNVELEPTMTPQEREIAFQHQKYFYTGNDFGLIKRDFEKWSVAGMYDFNNPPIITEDNYSFILDPILFSNIIENVCSTKGDGNTMYHSQMMLMNYDVFCVKNPGHEGPEHETFFNANLLGMSEDEETKTETSALHPGLELDIKRPVACVVAYQDRNGEKCIEELHGDWCRYFLQGYELTRGRPFWKNVGDIKLHRAKKKRKEQFKGIWEGKLI